MVLINFLGERYKMLEFKLVGKRGVEENRIIATISDKDISSYDTRLYDVIKNQEYQIKTKQIPSSLIKVREKSGKMVNFPIFNLDDLSNLYISKSGHLVKK